MTGDGASINYLPRHPTSSLLPPSNISIHYTIKNLSTTHPHCFFLFSFSFPLPPSSLIHTPPPPPSRKSHRYLPKNSPDTQPPTHLPTYPPQNPTIPILTPSPTHQLTTQRKPKNRISTQISLHIQSKRNTNKNYRLVLPSNQLIHPPHQDLFYISSSLNHL